MKKGDYRASHKSEHIARIYEEVVYKEGSYDHMIWLWEREVLDGELIYLKEHMPNVRYLDFGCGNGRILGYLEDKTGEAIGVDNASSMLMRAHNHIKKAKLIEADLTKQDVLTGETYDLITAFRVFLNAEPVLREEIMKVLVPKLRDQNSLFVFNMHGNVWSHRLFTKLWLRMHGRRLNTISYWQAQRFAETYGLSVERWYGFGVMPKVLYRWFGARSMYAFDVFLAHIPLMRYISYDLVFVCRKTENFT
jgi:SAM-dependent methyltransferase